MNKENIVCKRCNGTGKSETKTVGDIQPFCPYCNGYGKLDWIENIIGPKRPPKIFINTRKIILKGIDSRKLRE